MSGKPYTLKEMKGILEYLVENKYYTEVKGRKMWMNYANTSLTNRTWQSLKETFLKRILPDINNPYYKLTKEQIVSFRQGYDVEEREKNKLEIQTISDDSTSDDQKQKEKQTTTNNVESEDLTIEESKPSKISNQNRSSTETLVLDNCYENAEEIQKVLESPATPDIIEKKQKRPIKKFKDLITYSEPLAPILQEVINDFASESEGSDREPVMEIDLNAPDTHNEDNNMETKETTSNHGNKDVVSHVVKSSEEVTSEVIDKVSLNEKQDSEVQQTEKITDVPQNEELNSITPVNIVDKVSEEPTKDKENTNNNCPANLIPTSNNEPESKDESAVMNKKNISQNCSNTMDSLLPNNPEGFEINKIPDNENMNDVDNTKDNSERPKKRSSRKRATSEDNVLLDNKKKKFMKKMEGKANLSMKNTKMIKEKSLEKIVENLEKSNDDVIESSFHEATTSKSFTKSRNGDPVSPIIESPLKEKHDSDSPQMTNLCLKSVSLFEEQFNNNKYTDTDSSGVQKDPKKAESRTKIINVPKKVCNDNVILLKSNSESESHQAPEANRSNIVSHIPKSKRNEAIANVFGFSTGAVTSNRKTKLNRKRSISHHKTINTVDSDSSEWTSQTDSDVYVSPPRGRRNRHMKKYLKPKSSRVLSMEEEGGLFVMYGKRIYPVVKDGKLVKNYLTYTSNHDTDFEDEAFWKLKYEEEKKKSEELRKLLNQNQDRNISRDKTSPRQERDLYGKKTTHNPQPQAIAPVVENNNVNQDVNRAQIEPRIEDKIKIKFSRNNEEVHLEGNWPQINTVLEQVVNIFHKELPPKIEEPKSVLPVDCPMAQEASSGKSTPVIMTIDPEVHCKVDNIEKEIFQEIEERDKEDRAKPVEEESNVTKGTLRKSRRISSASAQNATKRSKTSKQTEATEPEKIKPETPKTPEKRTDKTYVIQTRTRTKTKDGKTKEASTESTESRVQTRKSSPLKKTEKEKLEDDIRYKLPTPAKRRPANKNLNSKNVQKTGGSYITKRADIISSDSLSLISESTQGYHESDTSPIQLKKKKKLSTVVRRNRRRSCHILLRSQRNLTFNNLYDGSDLTLSRSKINNTKQNSSEIYNSESYQYLFPNRIRSSKMLERIDEICAIEKDNKSRRFEAVSNEEHISNTKTHVNDVGSSSSVSLPLSPELSLVENMSITKEMLNSINNHRTVNEMHVTNDMNKDSHVNYVISDMDITLPLMQQICSIDTGFTEDVDRSSDKNNKTAVTESLLKEIRSVKIYDNSSDSIDRKLEELLLESTKKNKDVQNMEIDNSSDTNKTKKSGVKKRCSTPRKKNESKKSKTSKVDTIIEEQMETCSLVGGSSCPPAIHVFDENAMDFEEIIPNKGVKRKPKKDIIKVKILKPKPNKSKDNCETFAQHDNRMSVCTDSGVNDTNILTFPQDFDNSIELIHNHSETCLHANECIGDSVQMIENNNTVISLNSNSARSFDEQELAAYGFLLDTNNTLPTNNNDQNFKVFNNPLKSNGNSENGGKIMHETPLNDEVNSSLITEDMSDEMPTQTRLPKQPTKWFLFSEDEISNTNIACPQTTGAGSGANLKHIFPITCAIPNLSDITETSKEAEGRKSNIDLQTHFAIDWN